MKTKIYIHGAATTKFGELWEFSPRQLALKAAGAAAQDAGIGFSGLDAIFVGNMLSGILGGQEHLGAFFAEEMGLSIPAVKVEGACASGGLAVHAAYCAVASGQYRTVLVLGIEKMTDYKPEEVAVALMGAGSDQERSSGATFPSLYACLARAHMNKYGTTAEQMAGVAVKNHFHASLNPNAQYRNEITVEQVMKSTCIADPLKLLDCSPISDGAAALIISSRKSRKSDVFFRASSVATDSLGLSGRRSLTELLATKLAARNAFAQAGAEPADIDVAEVHDCFTIAEILALEDIGWYPKGEAAAKISRGETRLGGPSKLVVNTSGGLKACGHPVGATGVKQVVEVYDQLQDRCGRRQATHPRLALTHNVGGSGATAVVHILEKGDI